jgi:hypothetical protein
MLDESLRRFTKEIGVIRYFRYLMLLICAVQLFFAVAYIIKLPFAIQLWPLAYTNEMSFLFIASIFAAAAASTSWCILTKQDAALAGVALDYLTIFGPMTIFAFQIAGPSHSDLLTNFGFACLGGVVFGAALLIGSLRTPVRDTRPVPRLVYWSFVLFMLALVFFGGQMVLKVPNVLPWDVTSEGSVIYGWIFLGAAAYFAYAIMRPGWHNAGGQLAGFLAYDLVLIVPFLMRLPVIEPERRLSLMVYIFVVTYSGLLAVYYLFIHRHTRLWRHQPVSDAVSASPIA